MRVSGLGFRVSGLGFRVWALGVGGFGALACCPSIRATGMAGRFRVVFCQGSLTYVVVYEACILWPTPYTAITPLTILAPSVSVWHDCC